MWKISLSRKLKNSPLILTVAFIPPQSRRVPVPAEQTYSCSPALSVHTLPSAGIPQSPGQREQEISIVLQCILGYFQREVLRKRNGLIRARQSSSISLMKSAAQKVIKLGYQNFSSKSSNIYPLSHHFAGFKHSLHLSYPL